MSPDLTEEELDNYPGGLEAFRKSEIFTTSLEAQEIMRKYFFKKAVKGETFGSLERAARHLGVSVEEIYCISEEMDIFKITNPFHSLKILITSRYT